MIKPAFVKETEKDMDFQADCMVEELKKYAEENCIECDFVFETFIKAFHKKVRIKDDTD